MVVGDPDTATVATVATAVTVIAARATDTVEEAVEAVVMAVEATAARADRAVTTVMAHRRPSCLLLLLRRRLLMPTNKPLTRMPHKHGLLTTSKIQSLTLMLRTVDMRRISHSSSSSTLRTTLRLVLRPDMDRYSLLLPVLARLHHLHRRLQNPLLAMVLLRHHLHQLRRLPTMERFPHPLACKCGATTIISRLRQPFNLT
jgi:hypothetical protein